MVSDCVYIKVSVFSYNLHVINLEDARSQTPLHGLLCNLER